MINYFLKYKYTGIIKKKYKLKANDIFNLVVA